MILFHHRPSTNLLSHISTQGLPGGSGPHTLKSKWYIIVSFIKKTVSVIEILIVLVYLFTFFCNKPKPTSTSSS